MAVIKEVTNFKHSWNFSHAWPFLILAVLSFSASAEEWGPTSPNPSYQSDANLNYQPFLSKEQLESKLGYKWDAIWRDLQQMEGDSINRAKVHGYSDEMLSSSKEDEEPSFNDSYSSNVSSDMNDLPLDWTKLIVFQEEAFPGRRFRKPIYLRNILSHSIHVIGLETSDPRLIPLLKNSTVPPNHVSEIGTLIFDPSRKHNYLSFNTKKMTPMSEPISKSDLVALKKQERQWLRFKDEGLHQIEATITVNTSMLVDYVIKVQSTLTKPSLVLEDKMSFDVIQVGTPVEKPLELFNPSDVTIAVQVVPLLWRLRGFSLVNYGMVIIPPRSVGEVGRLSFHPNEPKYYEGTVYFKNNLTIVDSMEFSGWGGNSNLVFNRISSDVALNSLSFDFSVEDLKSCKRPKFPTSRYDGQSADPDGVIAVTKDFSATNTGNLPIHVEGLKIDDFPCEGFGFRVQNCDEFDLKPSESRNISISFRPDFSSSLILHELRITTAAETISVPLSASLPHHYLPLCSSPKPQLEFEDLLRRSLVSIFVLVSILLASCSLREYRFHSNKYLTRPIAIISKDAVTFELESKKEGHFTVQRAVELASSKVDFSKGMEAGSKVVGTSAKGDKPETNATSKGADAVSKGLEAGSKTAKPAPKISPTPKLEEPASSNIAERQDKKTQPAASEPKKKDENIEPKKKEDVIVPKQVQIAVSEEKVLKDDSKEKRDDKKAKKARANITKSRSQDLSVHAEPKISHSTSLNAIAAEQVEVPKRPRSSSSEEKPGEEILYFPPVNPPSNKKKEKKVVEHVATSQTTTPVPSPPTASISSSTSSVTAQPAHATTSAAHAPSSASSSSTSASSASNHTQENHHKPAKSEGKVALHHSLETPVKRPPFRPRDHGDSRPDIRPDARAEIKPNVPEPKPIEVKVHPQPIKIAVASSETTKGITFAERVKQAAVGASKPISAPSAPNVVKIKRTPSKEDTLKFIRESKSADASLMNSSSTSAQTEDGIGQMNTMGDSPLKKRRAAFLGVIGSEKSSNGHSLGSSANGHSSRSSARSDPLWTAGFAPSFDRSFFNPAEQITQPAQPILSSSLFANPFENTTQMPMYSFFSSSTASAPTETPSSFFSFGLNASDARSSLVRSAPGSFGMSESHSEEEDEIEFSMHGLETFIHEEDFGDDEF
eukprot:TRINITY_DN5326_c0_g1_i2.p1 TRINITY_DN5326_c0_g1~~TRINITY_DN5326_c0_g1_i2.p1  ORF type:complete len:1169 (-),score=327.97 TRINITY_DN5326_c0_g1_i2:32-3538(-)